MCPDRGMGIYTSLEYWNKCPDFASQGGNEDQEFWEADQWEAEGGNVLCPGLGSDDSNWVQFPMVSR
jgi:hypothetical protein